MACRLSEIQPRIGKPVPYSQCFCLRDPEPDIFRRSATPEAEDLTPYYCYIVRCRDDSLYTGITNNIERRIAVHNRGKGGAYTASRCPVVLVYSERVGSKGDALRRELEIKSLTRSQKLALIDKEMMEEDVNGKDQ